MFQDLSYQPYSTYYLRICVPAPDARFVYFAGAVNVTDAALYLFLATTALLFQSSIVELLRIFSASIDFLSRSTFFHIASSFSSSLGEGDPPQIDTLLATAPEIIAYEALYLFFVTATPSSFAFPLLGAGELDSDDTTIVSGDPGVFSSDAHFLFAASEFLFGLTDSVVGAFTVVGVVTDFFFLGAGAAPGGV